MKILQCILQECDPGPCGHLMHDNRRTVTSHIDLSQLQIVARTSCSQAALFRMKPSF